MDKYVRVMYGLNSHAGGFEYKLNEVNIAEKWNPNSEDPEEFGGFNFSTESKILRWLLRGDTLYDVEIPKNAEVIEVESQSAPHGVFRSNKIILKNPKIITEDIVMDLYLKSDLPLKSYYQCLTFLSLRDYNKVCTKIIEDKVNKDNVYDAIETFLHFFDVNEDERTEGYKSVLKQLESIKNS